MRKVFNIFIWTLLVVAVIAALATVGARHDETSCTEFEIRMVDEGENPLISAADIKAIIIQKMDTLAGKRLGEISLLEIKNILNGIPYIKHANIRSGITGNIKVDISLREPIVRIINDAGYSYYIDKEGQLLPINPGHPSRVIIMNGYVDDGISDLENQKLNVASLPSGSIINELYEMALHISGSPLLSKMIGQVWIGQSGQMELIPLIGNNIIIFGDMADMEDKFDKLQTYYHEGAGKTGWVDYKSIDLRYKNQVICSKK
jgi:cell division protein FtsQ